MTELGWNTWDVYHLNAIVHLPSGLRICFLPYDPQAGERKETFNWRSVISVGPHSGRKLGYSRCGLRWKELGLDIEFAAEEDWLSARVTPEKEAPQGMRVLTQVDGVWGAQVDVRASGDVIEIVMEDGRRWLLRVVEGEQTCLPGAVSDPLLPVFTVNRPFMIEIAPAGDKAGEARQRLERQAEDCRAQSLCSGGWLEDAAEGLTRSIHWNTIWEPIKGRVCTPVSRDWCMGNWGGYVLFDWDTFFCGLMAGISSPELMRDNFLAILDEVTPRGFVPNFGSAVATSLDRSQPPVGAYVVLKAWLATSLAGTPEDLSLLQETYPRLLAWHRWWMANRDGNGDGLLEWGSDPLEDAHAWENHTLRSAMYESGLDNSPMYDEAVFNRTTNTMEMADVGLNALYAADAWALSEMAALLGRDDEAHGLFDEYLAHGERINRLLWNDTEGMYLNRYWDGRFSHSISPTNFYPLLAGIVPKEWAEQMAGEHLLNPREFWGEFGLPSISRSDPGYRQKEVIREGVAQPMTDYWRGRIWGPMNFLVSEGLRRCGFDREAHELARKSVRLFLKEWQDEGHVHENYDDISGDGDNVPNADPLYHWGALLAYLGIQELADRETWEGWRFGNLDVEASSAGRIQVAEGRLEVACGPAGLNVLLNGRLLLATDRPAIIRGYRLEAGRVCLRLVNEGGCRVTVGGLPVEAAVRMTVETGEMFAGSEAKQAQTNADGRVETTLVGPCEVELNW
ncbi:MAG: hypothetical protein JW987_15620 [Anaerolineaceae bacterium]|nr:hypothetical protein [Anaerolineaceae bacterium]